MDADKLWLIPVAVQWAAVPVGTVGMAHLLERHVGQFFSITARRTSFAARPRQTIAWAARAELAGEADRPHIIQQAESRELVGPGAKPLAPSGAAMPLPPIQRRLRSIKPKEVRVVTVEKVRPSEFLLALVVPADLEEMRWAAVSGARELAKS